ncbi:hypothetical protein PYCC9005_002822 [Savitreella phatthalungensis]
MRLELMPATPAQVRQSWRLNMDSFGRAYTPEDYTSRELAQIETFPPETVAHLHPGGVPSSPARKSPSANESAGQGVPSGPRRTATGDVEVGLPMHGGMTVWVLVDVDEAVAEGQERTVLASCETLHRPAVIARPVVGARKVKLHRSAAQAGEEGESTSVGDQLDKSAAQAGVTVIPGDASPSFDRAHKAASLLFGDSQPSSARPSGEFSRHRTHETTEDATKPAVPTAVPSSPLASPPPAPPADSPPAVPHVFKTHAEDDGEPNHPAAKPLERQMTGERRLSRQTTGERRQLKAEAAAAKRQARDQARADRRRAVARFFGVKTSSSPAPEDKKPQSQQKPHSTAARPSLPPSQPTTVGKKVPLNRPASPHLRAKPDILPTPPDSAISRSGSFSLSQKPSSELAAAVFKKDAELPPTPSGRGANSGVYGDEDDDWEDEDLGELEGYTVERGAGIGVASVYVAPEYRNKGLASIMMELLADVITYQGHAQMRPEDEIDSATQVQSTASQGTPSQTPDGHVSDTVLASVLWSDVGPSFYAKCGGWECGASRSFIMRFEEGWSDWRNPEVSRHARKVASDLQRGGGQFLAGWQADELADALGDYMLSTVQARARELSRLGRSATDDLRTVVAFLPSAQVSRWHRSRAVWTAIHLGVQPLRLHNIPHVPDHLDHLAPIEADSLGHTWGYKLADDCYILWTHNYSKTKAADSTLYILGLRLPDSPEACLDKSLAHDLDEALVRLVGAAVVEARRTGCARVEIWDPKPHQVRILSAYISVQGADDLGLDRLKFTLESPRSHSLGCILLPHLERRFRRSLTEEDEVESIEWIGQARYAWC